MAALVRGSVRDLVSVGGPANKKDEELNLSSDPKSVSFGKGSDGSNHATNLSEHSGALPQLNDAGGDQKVANNSLTSFSVSKKLRRFDRLTVRHIRHNTTVHGTFSNRELLTWRSQQNSSLLQVLEDTSSPANTQLLRPLLPATFLPQVTSRL